MTQHEQQSRCGGLGRMQRLHLNTLSVPQSQVEQRVVIWFEPLLPPEASASILLFVLVIFIEPLQRVLGRSLRETAQLEMDRVQRLMAEIQQEARQGNVFRFARFIERRIKEQFELREVRLVLV